MAYEFRKLGDVETAVAMSDSASVLIEEDGEIKRVPKTVVGEPAEVIIGKIAEVETINDLTDEDAMLIVKNGEVKQVSKATEKIINKIISADTVDGISENANIFIEEDGEIKKVLQSKINEPDMVIEFVTENNNGEMVVNSLRVVSGNYQDLCNKIINKKESYVICNFYGTYIEGENSNEQFSTTNCTCLYSRFIGSGGDVLDDAIIIQHYELGLFFVLYPDNSIVFN